MVSVRRVNVIICTLLCMQPGRLKAVKAIGWYLDEHDLAQVSINLCDFETTPLHVVYEAVCHDAKVSSQ